MLYHSITYNRFFCDFLFDGAFDSLTYPLNFQVRDNLSDLVPSSAMLENENRSGSCRYCGLSHASCPSAFTEYYQATPIIHQTQGDSAFAKFYEATPIVGQTKSQRTQVKLMKKQMEVIKAKCEGKKAGGGDEKPSELLKAVKEGLERLDVKQEMDDTQDHGCDENKDNGDMEMSGKECRVVRIAMRLP